MRLKRAFGSASDDRNMIFEVDAEQISRLDSVSLVQLMKRLLLAECRLVDIPLRSATVPLQITVPDGGEDGRVEWTEGADSTDYLPSRFSVFQAKAQNLTESTVRTEVIAKSHKAKSKRGKARPKLNNAVLEALSRRGSYVMFCAQPFTGQKIEKLRKAIRGTITQSGEKSSRLTKIDIYDANKIADWVNTHPAVALWLTSRERRRSVSGFQTHDGWGRSVEITDVPWIDIDAPRFVPANRVVPEGERKDRRRNAWTFPQVVAAVSMQLSEDHGILRVVGPSGFGKSRFAYELFNMRNAVADHIDTAAIVYADLPIVGDEVAKLALEIADAGWPTILVVDDCPDDVHSTLAGITQRAGSRLRLVTADVETRMQQVKGTLVISLEPAPDKLISGIAKGIAPTLKDADTRFIQELSNGFPRMAVLAAQQGGKRREAIVSVDQVIERIIWGKRPCNERAQKALNILSLFDWLGLSGRVREQAAYVAHELAGVPEDSFVEDLKSFKPRGIIVQRGDFVQVQPIPLAARLAADRLSLLPDSKLPSFFARAPSELRMSLLRRLRWLDTSPAAQAFARQMLQENCLGNLAVLNSDFGSEAVDRLVHVEPDAVMATIDRLLGSLTLDQIRGVDDGCRHIVWALEKLAFRKKTFERAGTLLRRLGAAGTEEHVGNNASAQFKQLYQLYLSGTEASPEDRLRVLDEGLQSTDSRERELCVEALGRMLRTGHFTRGGGAEEIGSSERLEDWAPRTNGEIWNFHRAAMNRLVGIATSDEEFAGRARGLLGSHIRGLLNSIPFDNVKAMIERIVAHGGLWLEAIQAVNSWLYFDRRKAPEAIADKVRAFFDQLMPAHPVDLVVLYTHGWPADFNNPEVDFDTDVQASNDYEYAIREACKLAETIAGDATMLDSMLDQLVTSDAKTVFPFARRLAELTDDPGALFAKALQIAETRGEPANRQFFGGLIAGTDQRAPQKARNCVRAALHSPKLKNDAISMIGSGKLQPDDLHLVISLLQSGDVEPWQCATLSYGRGLDHLSAEQIMPLLDELGRHSAKGCWTVMDIVSMYLHGGKLPSKVIAEKLKRTLLARNLFDDVSGQTIDGYHLEKMIRLLLKHSEIDKKFVLALVKQLLSICRQQRGEVFYALDGPVRSVIISLLASHPDEVWREVSKVLISRDSRVRFYAEHLFEPIHDNHLGPGLLHGLPPDIYLDWVRKAPTARAEVVIKWLPIATAQSNGTSAWNTELESYVNEFGDRPLVLDGLAIRLRPRTWGGSMVPYLEPILPLLEKWTQNHPRPEVRRWACEQVGYISAEIDQSRKRDEERDVGIY
jgi:hypothetical protein